MSFPIFPDIKFQPRSPWGESIKATLRRSRGILRSSMLHSNIECTNADVRKMFLPFCIAKDPHSGKLCMFTSPNDIIAGKQPPILGLQHDPDLLKVTELKDDLRPVTLARYRPMLEAIHLDGFLPEVPSALEMAETVNPRAFELTKDAWLASGSSAAVGGTLYYLSGLITNAPLRTATLGAATMMSGVGVLGATASLFLPIGVGVLHQQKMLKAVKPSEVDVYTAREDIPELANMDPGLNFGM